jgi:hypothetical protein
LFAVLGQTQDFEHARQALYCWTTVLTRCNFGLQLVEPGDMVASSLWWKWGGSVQFCWASAAEAPERTFLLNLNGSRWAAVGRGCGQKSWGVSRWRWEAPGELRIPEQRQSWNENSFSGPGDRTRKAEDNKRTDAKNFLCRTIGRQEDLSSSLTCEHTLDLKWGHIDKLKLFSLLPIWES